MEAFCSIYVCVYVCKRKFVCVMIRILFAERTFSRTCRRRQRVPPTWLLLLSFFFFFFFFSEHCLYILFPLAFVSSFSRLLCDRPYISILLIKSLYYNSCQQLSTSRQQSCRTLWPFSVSSSSTTSLRLVYALFSNCMLQLCSAHFQLNIFRF